MGHETVGLRIKTLRKARGLSCTALAAKSAVVTATVLNAEKGKAISTKNLWRIAGGLGVKVRTLIIE